MMKPASSAIIAALAAGVLALAVYLALARTAPAPDVTFGTLQGETLTTASLRGKVVLVNFWATSCVTCIKEMPGLAETARKYSDRGVEIVAVAMSYDPPSHVLQYAEKNALPFKVALDLRGEIARGFGDVQQTPTTFVLDRRGNIVKKYLGEPDFAELHGLLEKTLADAS
jgi:peroxiredoxin